MLSSLSQKRRNKIKHLIRTNNCISQIVCSINVNKFQINKIKKNLIKHNIVIVFSTFMKRFRNLIEKIKTHLFEYINLYFIKYLNEIC